ncbi:MAG: hypothetical protein MJ082_03465 [Clostridia bacterium]|nr:hypothetical protein [Clostridia bacterium]
MKKIAVVLSLLLLIGCVFTFSACGDKACEHKFGEWTTVTEETCSEDGSEVRTCSLCNEQETRVVPKSDVHMYSKWTVETPATCKEAGVEKRVCRVCANEVTREIPQLTQHSYGAWKEETPSTCVVKGVKKRVCSSCGEADTQEIELSDVHVYGTPVVVEGTLFVAGTKTETCTLCNHEKVTSVMLDGVVLADDYSGASFNVDNQISTIRGIQYNANGKHTSYVVVEKDGNKYVKALLPAGQADPILNFETKDIIGANSHLSDILVDGKFTFSIKLAKESGREVPSFMLRLRGAAGSADTIVAIGVKGSTGEVYCLNDANVITTLTETFKTISITVDFKEAKITVYLNGTQTAEYAITKPAASSAADFDNWAKTSTFIFNGYFPSNTTAADVALLMDEIVILKGVYNDMICPPCTHEYGDWVVETPATYYAAGSRSRTCTKCGNSGPETLDKLTANAVLVETFSEPVNVNNTILDVRGVEYNANYTHGSFITDDGVLVFHVKNDKANSFTGLNFLTNKIAGDGKKLSDILVDGKFTFSMKIAKSADVEMLDYYFRLRGAGGAGDTIMAMTIAKNGDVSLFGTKVATLDTTFTTVSFTVDFTNAKAYGYINGSQVCEYDLPAKDYATWTEGTNFVLNCNQSSLGTVEQEMLIDDIAIIGGGFVDGL